MDDDEQMENEQGDEEIPRVPPAAARFLDRHRPIGISSADRDADRDGEDNDDNDGDRAEDQREADGKSLMVKLSTTHWIECVPVILAIEQPVRYPFLQLKPLHLDRGRRASRIDQSQRER